MALEDSTLQQLNKWGGGGGDANEMNQSLGMTRKYLAAYGNEVCFVFNRRKPLGQNPRAVALEKYSDLPKTNI